MMEFPGDHRWAVARHHQVVRTLYADEPASGGPPRSGLALLLLELGEHVDVNLGWGLGSWQRATLVPSASSVASAAAAESWSRKLTPRSFAAAARSATVGPPISSFPAASALSRSRRAREASSRFSRLEVRRVSFRS